MQTRTQRLLLGLGVVIAIAQITALISVERRIGAMESAFADMARRVIRAESDTSRRRPPPLVVTPSGQTFDIDAIEEACGTHAAEIAAALCDDTATGTRQPTPAADEPAPLVRPIDPARAASARAHADALVARAASSGRWTVASRDQLRDALEHLAPEEATRYRGRVLEMLNRGEIDIEGAMIPL